MNKLCTRSTYVTILFFVDLIMIFTLCDQLLFKNDYFKFAFAKRTKTVQLIVYAKTFWGKKCMGMTCFLTTNCYIDERWFYTTNHIWKMKNYLVFLMNRKVLIARLTQKWLSRRYPVKCMFLGVIGRSLLHRKLSGRMYSQRISKLRNIENSIAHINFSEDASFNESIENGFWLTLFTDDMWTVGGIRMGFVQYYCLEDEMMGSFKFFTWKKIEQIGNKKTVIQKSLKCT